MTSRSTAEELTIGVARTFVPPSPKRSDDPRSPATFGAVSDLDPLDRRSPAFDLALRLGLGNRGEAVVKFLDARRDRKIQRAEAALASAAQAAGTTPDQLFDTVERGGERVGDLFERTIESATQTAWAAKVTLLGRALALALSDGDDAAVDRAELLHTAIQDLEPVHARALWLLGQRPKLNPGAGGIEGLIATAFPNLEPVADQVAAVLRRHGLVTDPFYANGIIGLSPLGREVLQMLTDAGGVDVVVLDDEA